ncbi:hypothetical protein BU16DRAFT_602279 [Lophium mytilinum]|uniref:RING-type domain-containing protein n=1 Tax=Lophium mytilinum TaxID=390894 RepID=A0A6A6RAE2_9PEZI|nr:hypothetical protein BU16DRAFT_602279 [Lophium mytilinum]
MRTVRNRPSPSGIEYHLSAWRRLRNACQELKDRDEDPAQQYEHDLFNDKHDDFSDCHFGHFLPRRRETIDMKAKDFLLAIGAFQCAMVHHPVAECNSHITIVNVQADYTKKPTTFQRDEFRDRIDEMLEEVKSFPTESRKQRGGHFLSAIRTSSIPKEMWEIGQALREQINDGVKLLRYCHTYEDTYEAAGDSILIQPFSVPYFGPPADCAVCLEDADIPDAVSIPCSHVVHRKCLRMMVNGTANNSNRCPYCRLQLCERRTRVPGPTLHFFDQRATVMGMHAIFFARQEHAQLMSLYEFIFGDTPELNWLVVKDVKQCSWEDWGVDEGPEFVPKDNKSEEVEGDAISESSLLWESTEIGMEDGSDSEVSEDELEELSQELQDLVADMDEQELSIAGSGSFNLITLSAYRSINQSHR